MVSEHAFAPSPTDRTAARHLSRGSVSRCRRRYGCNGRVAQLDFADGPGRCRLIRARNRDRSVCRLPWRAGRHQPVAGRSRLVRGGSVRDSALSPIDSRAGGNRSRIRAGHQAWWGRLPVGTRRQATAARPRQSNPHGTAFQCQGSEIDGRGSRPRDHPCDRCVQLPPATGRPAVVGRAGRADERCRSQPDRAWRSPRRARGSRAAVSAPIRPSIRAVRDRDRQKTRLITASDHRV